MIATGKGAHLELVQQLPRLEVVGIGQAHQPGMQRLCPMGRHGKGERPGWLTNHDKSRRIRAAAASMPASSMNSLLERIASIAASASTRVTGPVIPSEASSTFWMIRGSRASRAF